MRRRDSRKRSRCGRRQALPRRLRLKRLAHKGCRLLLCGLLGATLPAVAQADFAVYTNTLVNGWQNWSWATVNLTNTTPVYSGSKSIKVTAAAWEAVYLHHDAFDTSAYQALTFWIHGGATGGQQLHVQAVLQGVAKPAVSLAALPANTWQQVTLSLTALGVTNAPNMDGFWIQDRSGTSQPAFYLDDIRLTATSAPATVQLTVNATQTVRFVDARHFGLNTAVWDPALDTTNTVGLLRDLDNLALRFPGGSLADTYDWVTNKSGTNIWAWASTFSQFVDVATNTKAAVFITVNYGSGTPAAAAAWVQHANVTNHLAFKYWEVGNENYGTWETDNNPRPNDPFTYATRFKDYASLMKAADPSIKIGAVSITGEDTYANYNDHPATNARTHAVHNGWTPVMLATLKGLGVTPDFLIYHRYEQAPGAENDATLLQAAATWPNDAADLRQQLNDYLGAAATNVELVCTENNSVYGSPGKQSTSLVNGLFLADSLGHSLQTEFNACLWWDLRNGRETGNNNDGGLYGWRPYGDYGVMDAATPADRYPTFYVAKLLKYFVRGGDRIVSAVSTYPLLTAFAAQRQDTSLTVLVINKHPTAALTANLALAGYLPGSNVVVYSYGIPQDQAARSGSGSPDVALTNLVVSPAGTNLSLTFAPYSVSVLALHQEGGAAPTATLTVTANPSNAGTVSGGGTYAVGSNVLLSATASNGWAFTSWNGGATNNPWLVAVLSGGAAYTANFSRVDSVGDGIPDWWRTQYFGGAGATTNGFSCATSDPDSDGGNNLQEYLATTDPTNSASRLALLSVAIRTNDALTSWVGGTNAWQALQCNSTLAVTNAWFAIFTNPPPTPLTNYFLHVGAGAATNLFYRLKAWRPNGATP